MRPLPSTYSPLLLFLLPGLALAVSLNVHGRCAEAVSDRADAALVLLADGRPLHSCAAGLSRCAATLPAGTRVVASYMIAADGAAARTGFAETGPGGAAGRACSRGGSPATQAAAGPSVGILYEGWHAPPATVLANISASGGRALSVEDVLRSNGLLALADIYDGHTGARAAAAQFFFQAQPQAGYYCIYRSRPGEAGVGPDCPGISATLARHAAELSAAGVDYVTVDGTNLGSFSPFADWIQLRPGEVVFEEWAALRSSGLGTPSIAAWQTVPTGCNLHLRWLALYNNATLAPLVHRDAATGKMVFFVPPGGDVAIIAAIEANGGRNDVIVQQIWAENSLEAQGQWSFFAPCTDAAGGYSTSVVGAGRGATGCGQRFSNASGPLARITGAQVAVSPSYQLGYGSLPWQGANKYGGLTFKRQFATVIAAATRGWATGAPAALPAHLYLSSYNEWTAQPQANPFPGSFTHSVGLGADAQGGDLWVDSFGQSLSRDIESSADAGGAVAELMASCLRVVRLAAALDAAVFAGAPPLAAAAASLWPAAHRDDALAALHVAFGGGADGLAACAVAGEACCAYNDTEDAYAPVWALRLAAAGDALATVDAAERAALVAAGWTETCAAYGGPTDFCIDAAVAASSATLHGPFALHAGACALPGRAPLFRCYDMSATRHFLSLDATCGGTTAESALGCVATAPSSDMARPLRMCEAAGGGPRYHVLDGDCDAGDTAGPVLGFVR
jgi:hypothetical protein